MTVSRDIIQRLLNVVNDTRRRLNTIESRESVLLTAVQTLTNKTLTTPTISNFTNATHDHEDAAGGGQLSLTTAVTGVLPPANGGTGVNNDTRTLTINTNSGTLAFGAASKTLTVNENLILSGASGKTLTLTNSLTVQGGGNTVLSSAGNYTLTIPKTGTVPVGTGTAGRIAEWVTDANTVQASTLAKTGAGVLTLAAAANYTLTVPATGTAALLGTANTFTAAQEINGNLTVDTNTLFVDAANNRVGIGTTSPGERLVVSGSGTQRLFITETSGSVTMAIKSASTGGFFGTVSNHEFFMQQNNVNRMVLDTDGDFYFANIAASRTNARLFINNATGNVGIGTVSPSAQLHVAQSSVTGTTPTLRLRQAALSEEFIRFDTTVGAGNPINTTALGAYYGRVRVHVEGVGDKWLALYD